MSRIDQIFNLVRSMTKSLFLKIHSNFLNSNFSLKKTNAAMQMASVITTNPPKQRGRTGSVSSASSKSSDSITRQNSADELEDWQRTNEERQTDTNTENLLKVCLKFSDKLFVVSLKKLHKEIVNKIKMNQNLFFSRNFERILIKQETHQFLFPHWKDSPRKTLQVVEINSRPCDKSDRATPSEELIILKACNHSIVLKWISFYIYYLYPMSSTDFMFSIFL